MMLDDFLSRAVRLILVRRYSGETVSDLKKSLG